MDLDLSGEVTTCAKRLLGCLLVREIEGKKLVGKIVETEAYHQRDAASHSYRGKTPRTEIMFGPPGFAYVYFTYGMHHCFNVVTGQKGEGSAVLIRALEPVEGIDEMVTRRGRGGVELTNGPAKLCYAFGIDRKLNKHDLRKPPLQIIAQPKMPSPKITATTRIGISKDTHRKWRFYITDNQYVSKI